MQSVLLLSLYPQEEYNIWLHGAVMKQPVGMQSILVEGRVNQASTKGQD